MAVAVSQIDKTNAALFRDLDDYLQQIRWVYAIPIPIVFALSGSLVGKWFSRFDEAATVSAMFVVPSVLLIPSIVLIAYLHSSFTMSAQNFPAIVLLVLGTLAAASIGRVLYQLALTATNNDNGFVTMFFFANSCAVVYHIISTFLVDSCFTI